MMSEQSKPLQLLLTVKARSCVQDVKLKKMVTELDMSNRTKNFPSVAMFDKAKYMNLFPAFRIRREQTIGECVYSKHKEKDNLLRKLELAKTEKSRKSMFSVCGSRICTDTTPDKRPPKVWSLTVSRTLPSINQCFTPRPPKSSFKRLFTKKQIQERPISKSTKVVSICHTPRKSPRTARNARNTPYASVIKLVQEVNIKYLSKSDVLPQVPTTIVDKIIPAADTDSKIYTTDKVQKHESPTKTRNVSHELFCSPELLQRGRMPQPQAKTCPAPCHPDEQLLGLISTTGSSVLPRIIASRERAVKTKSRHFPVPFRIPQNNTRQHIADVLSNH